MVGTNAQHPVTRFHSAVSAFQSFARSERRGRDAWAIRGNRMVGLISNIRIRPLRASIRSRVETSSSGITFYCTQADPEAHLARVAKKRVSRPDNFVNVELAIDPVTNRLRENT